MRLGDLDALRKNMEFVCMGIMAGTEPYNAPLTEIDNAPTVEAYTKEDMAGAYNEGYACGSREAKRPQGEWKVDGCLIACNLCGRILLKASELYNFCPNCGADMRPNECGLKRTGLCGNMLIRKDGDI